MFSVVTEVADIYDLLGVLSNIKMYILIVCEYSAAKYRESIDLANPLYTRCPHRRWWLAFILCLLNRI